MRNNDGLTIHGDRVPIAGRGPGTGTGIFRVKAGRGPGQGPGFLG